MQQLPLHAELASMLLSQPTDGMPAAPKLQTLTKLELLTLVNLASDHGLQQLRSVTQLRCAKGKSCGFGGLLVEGCWPSVRGCRSASAACGTQALLAPASCTLPVAALHPIPALQLQDAQPHLWVARRHRRGGCGADRQHVRAQGWAVPLCLHREAAALDARPPVSPVVK